MADSFSWRNALRSLLTVNEGPWRWRAGIEAALATGLPLIVLSLAGYQSLGLIASLGSFTALYSPQLKHSERLRALPFVGAGIISASLIGVLFAGNTWLTIAGVMLVASLACLLILGLQVGPPGPMPFILVNGVSGHLSAPVSLGGAGLDGWLVLLMITAGAVSSLLVVGFPLLLPAVRRREGPPRPPGELFGNLELDKGSRWVAFRVISAVLVASLVSLPLGIPRGYWVVLSAVAILQASHWITFTISRAIQRFLGTLGGVSAFALLMLLAPEGWWLVLMIAALQFMIELVVAKNYGLALLFITPVALVISTANQAGSPFGIIGERVLDSFLGAIVALTVLFAGEWLRLQLARHA
jgi:hypothetical protein